MQDKIRYAIYLAQIGEKHLSAKANRLPTRFPTRILTGIAAT